MLDACRRRPDNAKGPVADPLPQMYRIAAVPSPTSPAFRHAPPGPDRGGRRVLYTPIRVRAAHTHARGRLEVQAQHASTRRSAAVLSRRTATSSRRLLRGRRCWGRQLRRGLPRGERRAVHAFHLFKYFEGRAGNPKPGDDGAVVGARRGRSAAPRRARGPLPTSFSPADPSSTRSLTPVDEHAGRSSPRRRHPRAIAQIPPPERSPPIEISSENGPTKSLEALPRTFMHVYGGPPPCLFSVPSLDQSDRNVPQRWWFGCLAKGHGHCPSAPGGGATCSCRRWTSLVLRPGARTWSSSSSETRIKATQRRFRRKSWLSFTIARRYAGRRLLHRGCIMGHLRRTRSADGGRATYTC